MQATERIGQDIIRGESGLEYRRWPSAPTVNIYYEGREVDVFTLGGASGDEISHKEFRAAVNEHEATLYDEDSGAWSPGDTQDIPRTTLYPTD